MGRSLPLATDRSRPKTSFNIVRLLNRPQFPICLVLLCASLWQSVSLGLNPTGWHPDECSPHAGEFHLFWG